MKFEDYIDRRILEPLGMTRSTFRQPVPDAMKDLPQAGYNLGSDAAKPFEVVQAFPAGSMSVTAMDMTHFMRAHLNYGEYNGRRILSESAAKQMYARQAGWPDTLDAMALGFERRANAKNTSDARNSTAPPFFACDIQNDIESSENAAARRSFLPMIHATDSHCRGCSANTARRSVKSQNVVPICRRENQRVSREKVQP